MTTTSIQNIPSIFNYSNHQVRTVVKEDKSLWFIARDVAEALDIAWQGTKSLVAIPADWIGVGKLPTPQKNQSGKEYTTTQELIIINEPAVYKLAFRSNKPEAEAFTEWVASEVLPSIRKTGSYVLPVEQETLTPSEQHELSAVVKAKAEGNGKLIAEVWSRIKNKFKVAKYDQIKRSRFQDAIEYVSDMEFKSAPPAPQITARELIELGELRAKVGFLEEQNSYIRDLSERYRAAHMELLDIVLDLLHPNRKKLTS